MNAKTITLIKRYEQSMSMSDRKYSDLIEVVNNKIFHSYVNPLKICENDPNLPLNFARSGRISLRDILCICLTLNATN